ncbi:maleylpyruvate isomerase N-terminal domain-containing protein [Aeromicrobium endophyticum]|uniref:Maleylpyruvate isomerase family mycothiol-dependent enzyme n=1 Tax=Aeromicrobium endophyticum TaxID=2292704 RepID=A0A371PC16_9ACTN|nr:maleylpyruvate isomerase N-terminal domain-containing protein [Aeromicrobium endophyticum]REK73452.1 maleylpyruvate isomerase family mycothiol-dependent enzyme [Aeromicrobium endophyticum]
MSDSGLATSTSYDLPGAVTSAWDAFIDLAEGVDLAARTRLDGWTVRDVLLHLGTWDEESSLSAALATRGTPAADVPLAPDTVNAAMIQAHGDATADEILAALRASRDAVVEVLASAGDPEVGLAPVASQLGPIPLLTLVHAGCYELAVHALDLADAVDATVDPVLLRSGVAALTDTTGCLAAREGIDATIGINADEAPWSFTSRSDGGWTVDRIEGSAHGPRVSGRAEDVLEASAGRADPVRLVTLRHLKVKHLGGLLALTPIIDQVPGLPGGRGLKAAAKTLGGLFSH